MLEVFALFLLLPIFVALYYHESLYPYLIACIFSLLIGLYVDKTNKQEPLRINEALTLTAVSFIIVSLIGSIPYIYYFLNYGVYGIDVFINSFFESVSGFTTTGLSVFSTVEALPKSLLFFRAETQWLGGIGIIVVFLAILSELKTSAMPIYRAQGYTQHIGITIKDTARKMIKIYGVYTFIGVLLLVLAGLSFFESVNLAFCSISTGGFLGVDTMYSNSLILGIISMLMILGATSFFVHDKMFKGKIFYFFKNVEIRALFSFAFLFSAIGFFVYPNIRFVFFDMLSAITTTGYSTHNLSLIPFGFLGLVIILMIVGGSSASTSGGLKLSRILIVLKSIPWLIKRMISPKNAIIPLKLESESIDDDVLITTGVFVMTYLIVIVVSSAVFVFLGFGFVDSLFQIVSAMGTVGLSTVNIGALPVIAKSVLIVCMFLGRLEIFPILIFLNNLVKRE